MSKQYCILIKCVFKFIFLVKTQKILDTTYLWTTAILAARKIFKSVFHNIIIDQ